MSDSPQNIRALRDLAVLEFRWRDGSVVQVPYRFLRGRCPCAGCVDEFTGQRVVDVASIPSGIQLQDVSFTGNYALKISWSDGHNTGLYTWQYLAELCQSDQVTQIQSKSDECSDAT